MYKKIYLSLLVLVCIISSAQTYEIQYVSSSNGKVLSEQSPTLVWANNKENYIFSKNVIDKKAEYPYEITKIEKPSKVLFKKKDTPTT